MEWTFEDLQEWDADGDGTISLAEVVCYSTKRGVDAQWFRHALHRGGAGQAPVPLEAAQKAQRLAL